MICIEERCKKNMPGQPFCAEHAFKSANGAVYREAKACAVCRASGCEPIRTGGASMLLWFCSSRCAEKASAAMLAAFHPAEVVK